MVNFKFKFKIGRVFQRLLPWVVTIGIFTFLFHQIPITKVYEAAAHVSLWILAPVIFVGFIMYFLWDVLVFTFLFKEVGTRVPYREMLTVRGAAHLLTIVNYFAGAGSVAILMNRWKKIPISRAGSVVVFKLFLEYYMVLALCLLTAFHIPGIDLELFFTNSEEGNFVKLIILSLTGFSENVISKISTIITPILNHRYFMSLFFFFFFRTVPGLIFFPA